MKSTLTFLTLIFAAACSQDHKPREIVPDIPDTEPPTFVAMPHVRDVNAHQATVVVAINERGTLAAAVSDKGDFQLAASDLLAAEKEGVQQLALSAHHHVAITFHELKPGTRYKVLLAARDETGNEQDEPTALYFTTADSDRVVASLNQPAPALLGLPWTFKPQWDNPVVNLALVDGPAWLQWDSHNQWVTGVPEGSIPLPVSFTFTLVIQEPGYEGQQTFTVPLIGDPLVPYAWHLKNSGQTSFAWFTGTPGVDINLAPAVAQGLTGKGIKIRIADTGLQINHPDLVANINVDDSFNFASWSPNGCTICDPHDPSPLPVPGATGDHGTTVAGIAAAQGWNNIGSRGIAPDAELSGMNLLSPEVEPTAEHFIYQLNGDVDIVNQSFGTNTQGLEKNLQIDPLYDSTMEANTIRGRNGRGTIYVKAAGNGDSQREDANFDPMNTTPWTMVVGAVNALGEKSSYSTPGSSLWISAPGGEYGFQSEYERTAALELPKLSFTPAILSTDFSSPEFPCQWGYAKRPDFFFEENQGLENPYQLFSLGRSSGFNMGWHGLNPTCDYTASMNGTSAATPMIAGVVALLLEKNPSLTWRDVKHILATTARVTDRDRPEEIITIAGHRFVRTQSWKVNAGGYPFHNGYGFGLVDVGAAVVMADPATYRPLHPQVYTDWEMGGNQLENIPVNDPWGVIQDYQQRDRHLIVETVQIRINIRHKNMSHIGIRLESPSGTSSILLPAHNGAYYADFQDMVLASNAFYNEPAEGTWKINVVDGKGGTDGNGVLQSWSIRYLGHY